MAFPLHWWKSPFFYPIGNSPPACLTQDLAPEENAQILLLGCGDPRNILHTIHAGLGDGNRTLDFTCCDIETAVLARNMLLLTMIADGISSHDTWRIFYHFYLDSNTLQVLLSQCRALIQASADLKTWNTSTYGKYLRFCTEQSMIDIRGHWEIYLSVDVLPEPQMNALRKSFTSGMKETQNHAEKNVGAVSSFRASGPLAFSAGYNGNIQNDLFQSYWSTGIMKGRLPHPPASHVNPIFAYSLSGREFNVDEFTHVPATFHLAPVLAQSQRSTRPIRAEDLADAVTTQFFNWCKSFQMQVNTIDSSTTIRFFAGDCFLFCKALRKFHTTKVLKTGIYARPWGLSQIDFSTDYFELESLAPSMFNIIDTSNLADHLGLLNILIITVPLLQPKPWSVLHTHTVHGLGTTPLSDKAFADIPTLSLFLGVAPDAYRSDFSMHPLQDDLWSLSWKYPSSLIANKPNPYSELEEGTHVLACDGLQLGNFLYSVYTQMFAEEDVYGHIMNPTPASFQRAGKVQYIRESFVEFLSLVHGRVCVDWTEAFASFFRLGDSDEKFLLCYRSSYQDLICHLYLANLQVTSHNHLQWSFLRSVRSPGDPFGGWDTVPPVVSVTLKVPRERLKILEDMNRRQLQIPILVCMVVSPRQENFFSSFRPTFGDIVVTGHYQDAQVVIREDQAGWQGTSPLIVTFDAPSWIFTKAADTKSIALAVRPGPNTIFLAGKLERNLNIFETTLMDQKHVWITRCRPNESQDICRLDSDDRSPSLVDTNARRKDIINVDFRNSTRANLLTLRHTIEDQGIAKTLADGVAVSAKAIADTVVLVSFQGYEQLFRYPFPINGDRIKTRIARKSSYIEIVVPIRRDPESSVGLFLNPFPIAPTKTSFNLLNVQYVNLSKMPVLDLSISKEKLQWLSSHLKRSLPGQERTTDTVAADLTKSIASIFLGSSGLEKRSTVFELSNPTIGVYAVIFVNALRLDLSESQTVVADACVIPLNEKNSPKVIATLRRGSQHGITKVPTSDNAMDAWKALLPAVAESCRTWQHSERCEYRTQGIPACNEDKHASPLCQCGLGKDLGTFASLATWKEIQAEATRVAIPPLFSFSPLGLSMGNANQAVGIPGRTGHKPGLPGTPMTVCGHCGQPGQPTLLNCSRCKNIAYCSQKCQKAHWKTHKPGCNITTTIN